MCGIAGIFDIKELRDIDESILAEMNQVQFHRGPDEGGVHREPGIGLAHRRLSIIDISTGQQPLFNHDGSVCIVFNGEIYNFREIRSELEKLGYLFKTNSDTEVIVHAWEAWGSACVNRLRGMFAFAVWDRNDRVLFLARDRMGIKPLYYTVTRTGLLLFSSELKAILVHPEVSREMDTKAIEDYFALGYVPDPKTIFQDVHKLAPGHTLIAKSGKPLGEQKCYWDVPFEPKIEGSEQDIAQTLVEKLEEAVKIRLVSEVPLGAFLSGGVDSSSIVALMAKTNGDPVNTCSISFGDPAYNESEFARVVADLYKTNHHVGQVDPNDFDLIDKLASLYDEPYADSSAMPTYRVCELAKQRVTVALSGDGGDEHFAGYRRHRWSFYEEQVRNRIPGPLRRPLFGLLGRAYPKLDWAPKVFRAKSTFQALARNTVEGYLHSVSVVPDYVRSSLFSNQFKSSLQGYDAIEVFNYHLDKAPVDDALSLVQYIDMKTYLPGDILTKVDRASMAHSLEVRVPILDHEFVEWVSGISPQLKLKGREGKYIFKKALEPILPNEILYREKMGFAVPLAGWFRGPLKDRVRRSLLSDDFADIGIFDHTQIRKVVDDHQAGVKDHSSVIWSLLMFESFQRNVLRSSNSLGTAA